MYYELRAETFVMELRLENEFDQTYLETFANRVVQDVRL